MRLQERNVEHGVQAETGWEPKLEGNRVDLGRDRERSEPLEVQLVRGSGGLDVLAEEPDFVSDFEIGGGKAVLVGIFDGQVLGVSELETELRSEVRELLRDLG